MSTDYLEELERLHALREKGALSDEEFEQAKAKILEQASRPAPPVSPAKLDRVELRSQGLCFRAYPEWLMALLSFLTLGIYALFWLNHWHGLMPKRRNDDPSTARAIWSLFIPFYNYYWIFHSLLRLCTRLNEELAEAGLPDRMSEEWVRWYCILYIVPYVNFVAGPILGAIVTFRLQSLVNLLAQFDEQSGVRSVPPSS